MSFGDSLDAQAIVDTLGMVPHPEGGWYAETFRTAAEAGGRAAASAIYFLLREGERSHWHRVDACEIWLWHAGSALRLYRSADGVEVETVLLGAKLAADERPQAVVAEGVWQSAESAGAWSLVSCVVAPAFDFAGFTMGPAGWAPGE
jgi:predicted cupin superfamily sugar epimerase